MKTHTQNSSVRDDNLALGPPSGASATVRFVNSHKSLVKAQQPPAQGRTVLPAPRSDGAESVVSAKPRWPAPAVRLLVPHALLFSTGSGEESSWLCFALAWRRMGLCFLSHEATTQNMLQV